VRPRRERRPAKGDAPAPRRIRRFEEAGQQLTLRDRGSHVELLFDRVPILSSASLGTELAFGRLAASFRLRADARVLVGGLGFGSTLAGVLGVVGADAEVIVVEKLATVIALLRGELAHLAPPGVLDDRRVRIVNDDVLHVLARERGLDVVLLDVDNGPEWASFRSNARLYGARGLATAFKALAPGGAYAVWSGYPVDGFLEQLRRAGFAASVVLLRERGEVRARAYVGRRRPPPHSRRP
jgi:predicted membrane-bound spermidine synthase